MKKYLFVVLLLAANSFAGSGLPKTAKVVSSPENPAYEINFPSLNLSDFQKITCSDDLDQSMGVFEYAGAAQKVQVGSQDYSVLDSSAKVKHMVRFTEKGCPLVAGKIASLTLALSNDSLPSYIVHVYVDVSGNRVSVRPILPGIGAAGASALGEVTVRY